jgi:hypothetical protein
MMVEGVFLPAYCQHERDPFVSGLHETSMPIGRPLPRSWRVVVVNGFRRRRTLVQPGEVAVGIDTIRAACLDHGGSWLAAVV